jgi:integrase
VRHHQLRGVLFVDFRFQGKRCREYTALPDTPANRHKLERLLERVESEIAAGTFDYAATFGKRDIGPAPQPMIMSSEVARTATPPFSAAAVEWLQQHRVEWRKSHFTILDGTVTSHLVPHFGDTPIGAITKADVLAFRGVLAERQGHGGNKLSSRRINGILQPLRQILAEAADLHGFVSPMENLKPLKVRKSDVDPFTLDEVQRILSVVRADFRNYFAVRFFTGMRTGEVHGLKWKYVDFERRLIRIRETFVLGEDEYTKTDSSQRDIQMTQVVHDALKRHFADSGRRSEYVFCNRDANPIDNKNFVNRVWLPLLGHLRLPPRRPYQMRHTAATLWLASGEAPEWIARQLGHASTEMLFRVYSRYVPNLTRRDGSAIERLLASRFAGAPEQQPAMQRRPAAKAPSSPKRAPGPGKTAAANATTHHLSGVRPREGIGSTATSESHTTIPAAKGGVRHE